MQDGVECPTCKRSFETERGMRSHHGVKHDEPLPDRLTTCDECGCDFEGRPGDPNRFCSLTCKNDWLRGRSNTNHPAYDKKTVTCEQCGSKEKVSPSRANDYQFCSLECQGKWQSETRTSENAANWRGGVDKSNSVCDNCGDTFVYKTGNSKGRFCSHGCYHEYHVGENHSAWQGGDLYYSGRWKRQRVKALIRDQARCSDCSMSDKRHHEKHGRSIEVHHIEPYRSFDDATQANRLVNLVTLCKRCHRSWEMMSPLRPDTVAASD